jgi:hypothetical protein
MLGWRPNIGDPLSSYQHSQLSLGDDIQIHPLRSLLLERDWCGCVKVRAQLREGSYYGCDECECGRLRKGGLDLRRVSHSEMVQTPDFRKSMSAWVRLDLEPMDLNRYSIKLEQNLHALGYLVTNVRNVITHLLNESNSYQDAVRILKFAAIAEVGIAFIEAS